MAVIDAGVDTAHEDLKDIHWVNPKKKKGDNGTYGWSYVGSAKGNVQFDNLELTRQVRQYQQKDTGRLSSNDLMTYRAESSELKRKFKSRQSLRRDQQAHWRQTQSSGRYLSLLYDGQLPTDPTATLLPK
ncbi:hypothetical protein [Mucilaginibacter mallensis]|uniref:hypothetical protein n=1 Tax=Mucilaginibacter mallensis TaxID=652787 RepID=UPI000B8A30FC|nr:hypothetical protein [Mucilaginibacter mallensis]